MKIDDNTLSGEIGHFVCVLVDVDFANHLPDNIELDSDGSCIFISIFYENVHAFCSACHCVGHDLSKSHLLDKKLEKQTISKPSFETRYSKLIYVPMHDGSCKFKVVHIEDVIVEPTREGPYCLKVVNGETTVVKLIIIEKDGLTFSDSMPSLEVASHLGLG